MSHIKLASILAHRLFKTVNKVVIKLFRNINEFRTTC